MQNVEKAVPWIGILLTIVSSCVLVPVFAYNNFAPQKHLDEAIGTMKGYVDGKHAEAIAHSDANHADAISHSDINRQAMETEFKETSTTLREIREVVKLIEQRSWEGMASHERRYRQ